MKGFARIFEAVIASLIIIASLTFFISLDLPETSWDAVTLQTLSQDTLRVVHLNGTLQSKIRANNKADLSNDLNVILPKTVDFSLRVRNIPNSMIKIACVECSAAEVDELAFIVNTTDFYYHRRPISIRAENLTQYDDIRDDINILFFFDKTKISQYATKIGTVTARGGSVFLLSTVNSEDVGGYIGTLFNLTWSNPALVQTASFYDVFGGGNTSHYIAKYYANLSGRYIADVQSETFDVFAASGVAKSGMGDIAVGGSRTFVHVKDKINMTTGRVVWFCDYTRNDHNNPDTRKVDMLVKAALMWASGESYTMDTVKKTLAPIHLTSELVVYDQDTYIVELTIWQAFF